MRTYRARRGAPEASPPRKLGDALPAWLTELTGGLKPHQWRKMRVRCSRCNRVLDNYRAITCANKSHKSLGGHSYLREGLVRSTCRCGAQYETGVEEFFSLLTAASRRGEDLLLR